MLHVFSINHVKLVAHAPTTTHIKGRREYAPDQGVLGSLGAGFSTSPTLNHYYKRILGDRSLIN
jgi:hypothetical protein